MHASRPVSRRFLVARRVGAALTPSRGATCPRLPDVAAPRRRAEDGVAAWPRRSSRRAPATEKPVATDFVTVHYTGLDAGREDVRQLAHARAARRCFRLNRVIARLARVRAADDRRRDAPLLGPADLAYRGQAGRPAGMVVFDIELLDTRAVADVAPPDVKEPPADAKRTASGLAYKVLKRGHRRPQAAPAGARDGPLHRLDDRRQDVRQLRRAAACRRPSGSRRDHGLDRRRCS